VARWVLSYDLCDEVAAFYERAAFHKVETCSTTAMATAAKRARRREVVLVSNTISQGRGPQYGASLALVDHCPVRIEYP
jgi:hypothetical protein